MKSRKPVSTSFSNTSRGRPQRSLVPQLTRQVNSADQFAEIRANAAKEINYIPCDIVSVEATLLDPHKVRALFVPITNDADPSPDNPNSLLNTLWDPGMGANGFSKSCTKCSDRVCVGHNGYIDLGDPAEKGVPENRIIPPFINPEMGIALRNILDITCIHCGRVVLDASFIDSSNLSSMSTLARLSHLRKHIAALKDKGDGYVCASVNPGDQAGERPRTASCAKFQPLFVYNDDSNRITGGALQDESKKSLEVSNLRIYEYLDRISERSSAILGFASRSITNILQQVVIVLPPNVRKSSARDSEQTNRQFLEQANKNLLKLIRRARELPIGRMRDTVLDAINDKLLSMHSYGRTSGGKLAKKQGRGKDRRNNGYKEELAGKNGRVRDKQAAHRIDYSSRGVVTGDRHIDLGEVGVPDRVWRNTYDKIYVMEHNIDYFKYLYEQGALVMYFPREEYLVRGSYYVSSITAKAPLDFRVGDAFGVPMRDGRILRFGRNPSIHKTNILSAVAKRTYGNTFRMPNATTVAQNRDYDGDEGNKTFPQEPMAEAEARILLSIHRNIINTENSSVIIAPVMDAITTAYIMSNPTQYGAPLVDKDELDAMKALMKDRPQLNTLARRLIYYGIDARSPRGILSMLFPQELFYRSPSKDGTLVDIRHGILVSGTLTKAQFGISKTSLVQSIYHLPNGRLAAYNFVNDAMKVLDYYMGQIRGFSIGIGDTEIFNQGVKQQVRANQKRVERTIATISKPDGDAASIKRRENEAINFLQADADSFGHKLTKELFGPDNSFSAPINSGAKGDTFHFSHITAQGGQQFELGARLPTNVVTGGRGTVFDPFNDTSTEGAGYVLNSLGDGFNAREQISHHKASRVSLIDTSKKTADAGEYHHLEVTFLANFVIAYDGTLRDASSMIVQYVGGTVALEPFQTVRISHRGESVPFFADIDALVDAASASLYPW